MILQDSVHGLTTGIVHCLSLVETAALQTLSYSSPINLAQRQFDFNKSDFMTTAVINIRRLAYICGYHRRGAATYRLRVVALV